MLHASLAYPRALVVYKSCPTSFSSFSLPFLPSSLSLFLLFLLFFLAATKCRVQGHPPGAFGPLHEGVCVPCMHCKSLSRMPLRWHWIGFFLTHTQLPFLSLSSPLLHPWLPPSPYPRPISPSFPLIFLLISSLVPFPPILFSFLQVCFSPLFFGYLCIFGIVSYRSC